ncbi:carboxypeptidase-like regulatory domain-containing protein [Deferrisoma camini]|uniref:carboxypeptidase-like regulatory domain-containing protein n=1 Tax=Deferrisoma camini TaxID=1035120 RepID=UPI00046D3D39|nr:carboxypeptidase-like regulatory domain-containing protein [Deferrisoma camini]
MRGWAVLLVGAILSACAPRAAVRGRVMHDSSPLAGARVRLEPTNGGAGAEVRTGPDGRFEVPHLPPGPYRVEARGPGPLAAIPGQNPVYLPPGQPVWIGLQAVPAESPTFAPLADAEPGFGSIVGRVLHRGRPVEGAVVSLYADESRGLRGPGIQDSFPTGPDGGYVIEGVLAGRYWVVARKRLHEGGMGPVRKGDLYGIAPANPVPIRDGQETRLDIHLVQKEQDTAPDAGSMELTGTGVRGRVVDPQGRPVAGVYVFAYRNRTIGHGMPDFRTLPTGPDGRFELPLGEGGLFYLGGRENSGGSPRPGEWFGFYEGSPDHGLVVPRGRVLEGVEIVVKRVLDDG